MKAFNFFLTRPIFLLLGILMSSLTANAAPPEIISPLTASATVGQAFSYTITTASNDATGYGSSSNLPNGITRSGAILSGVPTEAGPFNITLYASNADGIGSATLTLTVSNPVPVITSSLEASGRVGQSFSYTISATNSPDGYSALDLTAIGLTFDPVTGIISGTPTIDINIDVDVSATNSGGTGSATVVLSILPALSAPSQPVVEISKPTTGLVFEGTSSQINVEAKVTPAPGETTDVVFLRWNNPSAPLTQVILAEMSLISTDATGIETYSADVDLGFNPNDRQLGGGSIQLEVVAYQTNAQSSADAGTGDVTFTVKPILEYLFPTEDHAMDSIEVGDLFASVRMNTNTFASVTARIAGINVVEIPPAITIQSSNGVYNFSSSQRIDFPGFYDVRITGIDTDGNTTIIERRIQISDSLAEPVAVVSAPTPGFTNEVFSAAVLSFRQTGREAVTVNNVGVVGFDVTYALTLISGGQGYYPRNSASVTIPTTDAFGTTIGITGVTVANGRVTTLPDEFTIFYRDDGIVLDPQWNTSGNAVMDDLLDPGRNGWISIAGQFFKANSELESYKIIVNGEDVTPGTGNLDPLLGTLDVPVTFYPGPGLGSPTPGDYLVYAQVIDKEGEVGTSEPLSFSIVPYEPLVVALSREGAGEIEQGDSDVFFAEVTPSTTVERVEFFDSASGNSLGLASSVVVDGQSTYRFVRDFNEQGEFGLYAIATAFNGQTSRSNPISVTVTPVNDLSVTMTSPAADVTVFKGESLTFAATATSTAGVASVDWVVSNTVQETDAAEPYGYTQSFDTIGSYRVVARATDNFGNLKDSSEIIVTVSASDLAVSLTSPEVDQTLVQGGSLDFAATATATLGVDRVEWSVDGVIVETDTPSSYALNHTFATVGSSSVFARAYDSVGNVASSSSINVQVYTPNPLLRDGDFVADIYTRLFGRSPTVDELATALTSLDGKLESRSSLVVDLLQSDNLQTATIASLIYLTMTGEYPDASELASAISTLTNGGTGVTDANALTTSLVSEYESRFAVLNTDLGFVTQLFKNKHSGVSPTPSSQVNLYNILIGGASSIDEDGVFVVPGYSGDLISYATQFALDNDLSGFQGASGFPLTSLHYYSIPNRPAEDSKIVILISALLGIEPTDTEINALSSVSLIDAVRSVLTDSRYYTQFPTSSADGFTAQRMATLGVFDASLVSATGDADADGVSNIAEILLNTNPSNTNEGPITSGSSSIDGSDFVFEFVRLKSSSLAFSVASVVVECADETFTFSPVLGVDYGNLPLSADQTGITSDYERVEYRVDTSSIDCNFFRLSAQ
jgi:hypothetical protein